VRTLEKRCGTSIASLCGHTHLGELDNRHERTAMHIKGVLLALALTAPAALAMLPAKAHAADGTLYEVSEAIDLKSNGKGFKSSEATLSGTIKAGTPLCPSWVTTHLGTDS